MATKLPAEFTNFIVGVTVCMIVSMLQFIALLNELPANTPSVSRNSLYFTLFFALSGMLSSYASSVKALTPEPMMPRVAAVLPLTLGIGIVSMGILSCIQKVQQRRMR